MSSENHLIVQSGFPILVEVDLPRYEEARDCLWRFTRLVKMPEHIHTARDENNDSEKLPATNPPP